MNMTESVVFCNMVLALLLLLFFVFWTIRDKIRRAKSSRSMAANSNGSACTAPHQSAAPTASPRGETFGACKPEVPAKATEGRPYSGDAVTKLDAATAGIDLSGKRRETFALTLPNGSVLHLYTPTKAVADLFADIGEILQRTVRGRATPEDSAELYRLAALLLGNNAERVAVDARELLVHLTLDDVADVLTAYMDWLTALIESKN